MPNYASRETVISFFFISLAEAMSSFYPQKEKEKTQLNETDLEIAMSRKVTPNTPYYAYF